MGSISIGRYNNFEFGTGVCCTDCTALSAKHWNMHKLFGTRPE